MVPVTETDKGTYEPKLLLLSHFWPLALNPSSHTMSVVNEWTVEAPGLFPSALVAHYLPLRGTISAQTPSSIPL